LIREKSGDIIPGHPHSISHSFFFPTMKLMEPVFEIVKNSISAALETLELKSQSVGSGGLSFQFTLFSSLISAKGRLNQQPLAAVGYRLRKGNPVQI